MMKLLREIFGYLLGGVVFVLLVPWGMWLLSGRPELWCGLSGRIVVAWVMMAAGLALSVWTIVYMRLKGDGNPMDTFGHEVAPWNLDAMGAVAGVPSDSDYSRFHNHNTLAAEICSFSGDARIK